ncbi:malate dehydrogenase [Candidatus Falkowbacteria bacterium RIFOXYD2_FULL_35_9]|uniref:Malate dehydrogenase n=1 Tax=Candidatus Falkowbacteria bacterium RIFOXYC2_FULL_36_12 TaxID=1798002 RepID=A0A1F5T0R9_9BACT|nr:MAG: malate dehydrogenase [Candidatus Falkowbacteria bacterium RIFOXYC2_FULL_36_12]OGF47261.1 MAG: malate dehydrogenase [Candidatus Falkowbacteria bacterium RIFOXYD2_FULL_35_9]
MDIYEQSLLFHEKVKGKLSVKSKVKLETREDLSLAYTPGVAEPCRRIQQDNDLAYKYTIKGNSVAVITDGSAVLGLGNIGSLAGLPVMEGKAILFKEFAGIDAYPICLAEQSVEKTIETVKNIAPSFGGINLEDIKAPECFEIENALQDLGIPVFHDDQHGTAIVVLAGLINALRVVGKSKEKVKVVVNGAGAAGIAITKLLIEYGFDSANFLMLDSKGIIFKGRDDLVENKYKMKMAEITNKNILKGDLAQAMDKADIFIGVSVKNIVNQDMIRSMNGKSIIFAMANPEPEIMPDLALEAGAMVVATGRSDFPNQVNNVLVFPGIFRGALDMRAKTISLKMKLVAAEALAGVVTNPTVEHILPSPLEKDVSKVIAEAVMKVG